MTIKLPSTYGAQLTNDWLGLSEIKALEWDDLIGAGHLVYARLTSHMGGHVFEPPWESGSTSLGYESGSTSRDLDEIGLGGFAERETSGENVQIEVVAIAEQVTIDYTITNLATSTQLATGTFGAASFDLVGEVVTLSRANVVDSGRPQFIDVDVQASVDSDGNTAKIWQLRAGEREIDSASDLPTG